MTEEKKLFAEWYSLGAQEMPQGSVETRAMLVPGAGVLVQIEARTAGGRAALTSQWLPGVVIYEGRLVGGGWADNLMKLKMGARANMIPEQPVAAAPVAPPAPVVAEASPVAVAQDSPPVEAREVLASELQSVLTSAQKVSPEPKAETTTSDSIKKLARKTRTRKSDPPAQ